MARIQISAPTTYPPPLPCCVTIGKSLSLSVHQNQGSVLVVGLRTIVIDVGAPLPTNDPRLRMTLVDASFSKRHAGKLIFQCFTCFLGHQV